MTFFEKFKEVHPNAPRDLDGTFQVCPYQLGYEADPINCDDRTCVECWGREMPTPKTMQEKFFEMFPDAPSTDGTPNLCPHFLGWKDLNLCTPCGSSGCILCWSQEAPNE